MHQEQRSPEQPLISGSINEVVDVQEMSVIQIMFQTVKIAIPMALAFTFTASMLATSIMISRLSTKNSEDHLAAATLITMMTNIFPCLAISPLFAMNIMASKQEGKLSRQEILEDLEKTKSIKEKIENIFKAGMFLSTLIMPIPFFGMFFSSYILSNWFGQNKHLSDLAQENLRAYSIAMPGFMYRVCVEQIMFAFGKTTPPMLMGLFSFAVGTGISYLLSFSPYKFGLAGIAYGYVADAYLSFISYSLYISCNKIFKDFSFFNFCKLSKNILKQTKKMLSIGLPITLQMAFEIFSMLLVGLFSGWLGEHQLAAQNFATQLFIFAIIPSVSFGDTVAQEVSRLIGRKDFLNAMRFSRYGLLTTVLLVLTICIPVSVAPSWLITILALSISPLEMTIAKSLILLAATQTFYDTVGYGIVQVLRSAGDLYFPTILKLTCLSLGILSAYILGFHTFLNIYGVGIGSLLGVALGTILLFPRWLLRTTDESLKNYKIQEPEELNMYQRCLLWFDNKKPQKIPTYGNSDLSESAHALS